MSVMSAAEARQTAGADPDIPLRRLQIARSATDEDEAVTAGSPLGTAGEAPAEPGVTGSSASALRVTQVRVVREVRVRTLRADRARRRTAQQSRTVQQSRAATQPTVTPGAGVPAQATMVTRARVATQATATMQAATAAHVTSQGRVPGQAGTASQTRAATHSRMASQAQTAGQAWTTSQTRVQARPGPVRLTRRGRRVVAALVIGVVIVAVTVLWMSLAGSVQASSHGAAQGSPYRGMTQVVVQPGQTLWSIAAAAEPSGNAWAVVQQIVNVNALSSASVQTGQLLWVPKN
jgi:hypothetical protein